MAKSKWQEVEWQLIVRRPWILDLQSQPHRWFYLTPMSMSGSFKTWHTDTIWSTDVGQPTLIPQKLGHYGLRTVQVQLQGYLLAYYQLGGGSGPSQFPPGSPVTPILVGGVRKK